MFADKRKINMFEALWRNDVYFSSREQPFPMERGRRKRRQKGGHALQEIRKSVPPLLNPPLCPKPDSKDCSSLQIFSPRGDGTPREDGEPILFAEFTFLHIFCCPIVSCIFLSRTNRGNPKGTPVPFGRGGEGAAGDQTLGGGPKLTERFPRASLCVLS